MVTIVRFVPLAIAGLLAAGAPALAAPSRTVTLAQEYSSGLHGTAVLTQHGNDLTVVIELAGRHAQEPYLAHIHGGACDQPHVRTAYQLAPVVQGRSTTTVPNLRLETLTHGTYSLGIHARVANVTHHLACGAIGTAP
ncbi:MAG TPA: hypothetical protein VMA36_00770 [Candidatus Limnocylindria bacterium]|jgi:hypothetical protein|nr:hypothetical protein [Candidatus Limnocylindria bacterium]